MFVSDSVLLSIGFDAAHARLAHLVRNGALVGAAADAYQDGITGAAGSPLAAPRLAGCQFRDLVVREDLAVLTLRWDVLIPGSEPVPLLDADITLTPAHTHATLLHLTGVCRPPSDPGRPGLDRTASRAAVNVAVRSFLGAVATAITRQQAPEPERS